MPRKNSILLVFVPIIIYFSMQFTAGMIVGMAYVTSYIFENPTFTQEQVYEYLLFDTPMLTLTTLFGALFTALILALLGTRLFRRTKKEVEATSVLRFGRVGLWHAAALLSCGFFIVYLVDLFITNTPLMEYYAPVSESIMQSMSGSFLLNLLAITILTPIAEELVFRAGVYNELKRRMPLWSAILFSAVIFGVMHGNLIQNIYAALLGVVLCVAYEKYGSVWAPILIHMGFNLLSLLPIEPLWVSYVYAGVALLGCLYTGVLLFKNGFPAGSVFPPPQDPPFSEPFEG